MKKLLVLLAVVFTTSAFSSNDIKRIEFGMIYTSCGITYNYVYDTDYWTDDDHFTIAEWAEEEYC